MKKYESLKHIKNKIVIGHLNGSSVYAQPIKTWSKKESGGANTAVRNKMSLWKIYGGNRIRKHLSDLWKSQNTEDTSAKGKHV